MSTTERDGHPSATTPSTATRATTHASPARSLRPGALVPAVVGLLAGATVLVVGLPADSSLFGSALADLTLPAALLLVLVGLWASGWASATRAPWRVVDIVTASVLGVALGLVFVVWNLGWTPLSNGLAFFPPLSAVAAGVWLLPAVVGGLVVRRPGAAVYTELVAATLSALIGNQWGFATVWYGLLEGLGAEVVLAVLLYRRWGLPTALLAGAGAGVVVGAARRVRLLPGLRRRLQGRVRRPRGAVRRGRGRARRVGTHPRPAAGPARWPRSPRPGRPTGVTPQPGRISLRGWGWRHAGRRAWAVRGVDLDVEPGERVLLLGPSGAGKSTLLAGLAGLLDGSEHGTGEEEGGLLVDGVPAREARPAPSPGRAATPPRACCCRTRRRRPCCPGAATTSPSAWRTTACRRPRSGDGCATALDAVGLDVRARPPDGAPVGRAAAAARARRGAGAASRACCCSTSRPRCSTRPARPGCVSVVADVLAGTGATCLVVEHRVRPWLRARRPGRRARARRRRAWPTAHRRRCCERHGARLAAAGRLGARSRAPSGAATRARPRSPAADRLLVAEDLAVTRDRSAPPVLSGVDLARPRRSVHGRSSGRTAAGKSTLLLALAGLARPAPDGCGPSSRLADGARARAAPLAAAPAGRPDRVGLPGPAAPARRRRPSATSWRSARAGPASRRPRSTGGSTSCSSGCGSTGWRRRTRSR